jgi:hypothetical protein
LVAGVRGAATCWQSLRADQISLTDPDNHAMAAHTHVAVGYNAQVAVDTKLIEGQH